MSEPTIEDLKAQIQLANDIISGLRFQRDKQADDVVSANAEAQSLKRKIAALEAPPPKGGEPKLVPDGNAPEDVAAA